MWETKLAESPQDLARRAELQQQQMGTAARGQAHALFAQTMGYVAATAALFALGAWLGRDLAGGAGIIAFIAAFAALIGDAVRGAPLRAADRRPADRAFGYATRRDLTALARVSSGRSRP